MTTQLKQRVTAIAPPVGLSSGRTTAEAAPELSIIVPTYCEAENIEPLIRAIDAKLDGFRWEIIFIDDDSPDGTIAKVRAYGKADSRIRGIRRIGRRGLSGALIEGILAATSDFVAVMDCDMQHDEKILLGMLDAMQDGADLVVATRYVEGGSSAAGFSTFRQRASEIATRLANLLLKTDVSDPMSGFFMMRRSVFEQLAPKLSTNGFKLLLDILASQVTPLRIVELPYTFRPRLAGQSKLNELVVVDFLTLLMSKATGNLVPPRFFMFAAVGVSGVAVHLLVLKLALAGAHLPFAYAQLIAAYSAMLWNFVLNNVLTYRDRQLKGLAAVKGFVTFALVCSIGTLANVGVAQLVYSQPSDWLLAGVAGALMAAVFNYTASSGLTWRKT